MPLFTAGVTNAALFAFYGTSKRVVASLSGTDNVIDLSLPQICAASILAAPFYCVVLTPIEVLKVNLQNQAAASVQSPFRAARALGLSGLYKGYLPTLGSRWTGSPAYFCSYEASKSFFIDNQIIEETNMGVGLICGFLAGVCFWGVNFPLDLIKTRIQTNAKTDLNPWKVAHRIIQNEGGVSALYRGFLPCILRSGPANAVAFGGYELGMQWFNDHPSQS